MFYYAAKIGFFLIRPSNFLVILLVLGVLLMAVRLRRLGLRVAVLAAAGLLIGGFSPLANWLMLPLENRFPVYEDTRPVDGIVLLGGFLSTRASDGRGTIEFTEAADRFQLFVTLARRHPDARLVISGGVGKLFADVAEAPIAVRAARDLGIDEGRIIVESRSRDTYENAQFSTELAKPEPGQRWLIVTSAYHMPRAMGAFRKAGFPAVAAPTDFRTAPGDATAFFDEASAGLARLDVGVREWIGLAAYWFTGRIEALFPGP
ncbi:MAG: YdcF family protein [Flavobacteriaceae bacterium]